ncbi:MAG: radical SAM protein [Candidatus Woesearchaeota archaeon]
MSKRKIKDTHHYSWKIGELAKGCQLCVKGEKTVFFVTGICPRNCYFCPLSELKKNKDVVYANEMKVNEFSDLADEIKTCDSKGVGITGGDPLARLERTVDYIKKLKKEFGKDFHIHLYAPLTLVSRESLEKLHSAGLDEIRFHPDIDDKKLWDRIMLAKEFKWNVGIEIPVLPDREKETIELMDYLNNIGIDFLNLNELEFSSLNSDEMKKRGFRTKNPSSYGAFGSEALAKKLMKHALQLNYNVHACTAKLKDRVQLGSRLKNRSENAKKSFDAVDDEGLLTRGAVYTPEIFPSFDYSKALAEFPADRRKAVSEKLNALLEKLEKSRESSGEEFFFDEQRLRILAGVKTIKMTAEQLKKDGFKPAVVKEYPTGDCFIVELEFL